jgi:hypothetical protein
MTDLERELVEHGGFNLDPGVWERLDGLLYAQAARTDHSGLIAPTEPGWYLTGVDEYDSAVIRIYDDGHARVIGSAISGNSDHDMGCLDTDEIRRVQDDNACYSGRGLGVDQPDGIWEHGLSDDDGVFLRIHWVDGAFTC